ncbi:MAG: hypothetical protein K5886_02635 [Lachnospiraceae bacterium]|nr:hypothetical protein [Lachnospiraceae bacterium]
MADIYTYLVPLPPGVKEMVVYGPDDAYTIYLNDKISSAARLDAFHHAVRHIYNNDFEKTDVQEIEAATHE